MAELFKNIYNKKFINDYSSILTKCINNFDAISFSKAIFTPKWEQLELKERMRHITYALNSHIKGGFKNQVNVLLKSIAEMNSIGRKETSIEFMFLPDFIEVYGLQEYKVSIEALEIFTQYSTSEFAIRPFIEEYPKQTITQLIKWSQHENHHVRRLSTEGSRPKLPWASSLRRFIENPEPVLPILQNLKDDESEYVRKSVANHLNDISKSQPELALELAKDWFKGSKNMRWVVKHGLRTLLKQGDKRALTIFGFDDAKGLNIKGLTLKESEIYIGGDLYFSFEVKNTSNKERNIRLEYKIAYVKANGSTSRKVFQISEFVLNGSKSKKFKKKQRFTDFSTRKHYPGEHTIIIVVNGKDQLEKTFMVKS